MLEISTVAFFAVVLKIMWSAVIGAVIGAVFVLWPIGDQGTTTEQKVFFMVVALLGMAFVFELVTFTA